MGEAIRPAGAEAVRERIERQRRDALTLANERRLAKADLRRRIKQREVDPVLLLQGHFSQDESTFQNMALDDFLLAIPRIGRGIADEILIEFGASSATKIGKLSATRRGDLAALLAEVMGKA